MAWLNSSAGYGGLTKVLHWGMALLIALQLALAWVMLTTPDGATTAGLPAAVYYNWHKSLGLVAFLLAAVRIANRRLGTLPPWAPSLSATERQLVHRAEQILYAAMIVMPLSGLVYVMAGGYGVNLFGIHELPRPAATNAMLAGTAKWAHIVTGYALILALGTHLIIVLHQQFVLGSGIIARMWPGRPLASSSGDRP
jgi:cytochrome b561